MIDENNAQLISTLRWIRTSTGLAWGLVFWLVFTFGVLVGSASSQQPINQHDCDTCGCEGLIDAGPIEMSASRTITVWIENGSMAQLSSVETRRLMIKGVHEFDQVCGLSFKIVDQERGARVRFYFDPELTSLGRAWSSGRIKLNSTRKINNAAQRRVIEAVTCHELGHVFGLSHGGGRLDIMHADLGYHWSVAEIQRLQKLHGTGGSFHPTERVTKGDQLRDAVAKFDRQNKVWRDRVAKRNAAASRNDWELVRKLNPGVLQALRFRDTFGADVARLHGEWWTINKAWNMSGVNGVVKLGN